MKEVKVISEEKKEQLQAEVDAYCKKRTNSRLFVRIVAGFLAGTGLCLLTSCGENVEKEPEKQEDASYLINMPALNRVEDKLSKLEIKLEKELAEYLSEKTGVSVELINMTDVNLVQSSDNYLVITGKMINDVKVGTKDCTVTLKLSDAQFETMKKAMDRYVSVCESGFSQYAVGGNFSDDTVAAKYASEFLQSLNNTIKDEETKVEVIYDKNDKTWLYEAPEKGR